MLISGDPSRGPDSFPPPSVRPCVWVVDDSRLQATVAREALGADVEVVVFASGAAALEHLGTGAVPRVMILDWHMPDMSGVEVCRFIRATYNSAELPIVILTATGTSQDLLEALAAGANDFMRKPASGVELSARVAGLLRLTDLHSRVAETERELRLEAVFRERFMATLAHDLRQPLSTILMGGHMLRELGLPDRAVTVVERQVRAAERMKRMVTDLLESTRHRPESGMPIAKRLTDFEAVARTVVDELRSAHPDRELQLSAEGSCVGYWDADRLAQILSNLVGNAIAHGEPSCRVDVRLDGNQDHTELVVTNRGRPITEAMLEPADPASRRPRSARQSSNGFGLGLHIVHHIVRAHGGTLSTTSDAGETRVLVRLPGGDREALQP